MTTLYCTRALLDSLDAVPQPAVASENHLGAWTATLVLLRPARLVLAVSEHGRLPLVLAAEPWSTLLERLPEALYQQLLALRVPADLARSERDQMQPLLPAVAAGQGHLDQLRTLEPELASAWERGVSRSPAELALMLAHLSSSDPDASTAAQATRRRLHLVPDPGEVAGL
ncbi:MAG: hypothetical protein KF823_10945 [Xanthomonadales bacterium]|nr:hypothetical protein [Xanthomonadales bacterium]